MSMTLPPPTGPSLESTIAQLKRPVAASPMRPAARTRSWVELVTVRAPHVTRSATFLARTWARIIDLFVYAGPVVVVSLVAWLFVPRDAQDLPAETKLAAAVIAVPLVVAVFAIFTFIRQLATDGSTVGRQARRLVVVRAGSNKPIGYGRAIVRLGTELAIRLTLPITAVLAFGSSDAPDFALTAFIGAIVLNALDVMWMLWDPRHQTLHDKAAGSVVVQE